MRDRILEFLRLRPGARLSRIWKEFEANRGTAKYHLLMMERSRAVRVVREPGATRYFPPDVRAEDAPLMAVLLRGRVSQVAERVLASPGVAQAELTAELPMSRKVFRDYADRMIASGLLEERKGPHERWYFPTARLREVWPRMPPPSGGPK